MFTFGYIDGDELEGDVLLFESNGNTTSACRNRAAVELEDHSILGVYVVYVGIK